jgi:hypothetical protein
MDIIEHHPGSEKLWIRQRFGGRMAMVGRTNGSPLTYSLAAGELFHLGIGSLF